MAGKKNPNLGDKLRQEREGAENTLRDSRSKTADSSTGDSSKKKAEHRRQIRHEADLAKMRSKKLKSEQDVKAKKNAAASGKKGGKPKNPGNLAADALSAKAHQSVRNADQDNNSGVEAAHFTEGSAEGAARAGSRSQYGRKLRQYKKLERLEKKADKDAVDLSRDEMGQYLVYDDVYIVCENNSYGVYRNDDDSLTDTVTISQNEAGIDTEDRIIKLKKYIANMK